MTTGAEHLRQLGVFVERFLTDWAFQRFRCSVGSCVHFVESKRQVLFHQSKELYELLTV